MWNYAKMFATSMKSKWDLLIYVDLFSGSGRSNIENMSRIIPASPILALDIPHKFNRYIFCDQDKENIQALSSRVAKDYPDINVTFIEGDVNQNVDSILSQMIRYSQGLRALSFCFVDPYKIKNLNFQTIKKLAERYIDYLILIPSFMDAHRNLAAYFDEGNSTVEEFTGMDNWRAEWKTREKKGIKFGSFISDLFGQQMLKLKYNYSGLSDMKQIRSHDKNLPLYHLAFFSRSQLGNRFWKEAQKYSDGQLDFF
jgi:three-Cys-motif partner protein